MPITEITLLVLSYIHRIKFGLTFFKDLKKSEQINGTQIEIMGFRISQQKKCLLRS